MQFKHIIALAVATAALLSAPSAAQDVAYEGFASTVSCSGSSFECTDGGAVCCNLPTGFGFSVQFNNLPAGTQGQGYTNGGCTDFLFSLFGPGTKCFNGGGVRATNMNWFHSPQSRRGVLDARDINERSANCSSPISFKYETPAGVERKIKVTAAEGAAQTVADLYFANDGPRFYMGSAVWRGPTHSLSRAYLDSS